ncbi:MAG: hypothetical protein H7A46_07065 [Verrucomicrobiales bacterium]|nr:hypothetical protein [Verrucomicrobiales bacterium]
MSEGGIPRRLHVDFDWEELYRRLDEETRMPEMDPKVAEAVSRLLELLIPGVCPRLHPHAVGLRLIALAWVLSPGHFPDTPSMRELARRCGVHRSTMTLITAEISRMVGWRNRAQRRAWNWRGPGHREQG